MSRRAVVQGLALGLILATSSFSPAAPDRPRSLRDVARERCNVAREGFMASYEFLIAPPPAQTDRAVNRMEDVNRLILWSRRWMDAELDLSETKAARIAAINLHLERVKRMEAIINELIDSESSGLSRMDLLSIAFDRLEAETLLAKEHNWPK